MPPKKRNMVPNADPDPSRDLPLAYSTFHVPPPINAKNVSSTYVRTEAQTALGRSVAALGSKGFPAAWPGARSRKRKRAGDKTEGTSAGSGAEDEDEEDEDEDEDDEADELDPASNTVVIHLDSSHLRFGMASDLNPTTMPLVLARRHKGAMLMPGGSVYAGEDVPQASNGAGAAAPEQMNGKSKEQKGGDGMQVDADEEEGGEGKEQDPLSAKIDVLRLELRSIMRGLKLRGVTNGRGLASSYNANARPEKVPEHNDLDAPEWTAPAEAETVFFGTEALRLPCFSEKPGKRAAGDGEDPVPAPRELGWRLRRPFAKGGFNLRPYLNDFGASAAQAVLADVRSLLQFALQAPRENLDDDADAARPKQYGLGLTPAQWREYGVIVVVPDLFSSADAEAIVGILLSDLGFSSACIQQEAVAATFGAGLSSACVVCLGEESTSIACVDEGLVMADSRMILNYGGSDITDFFAELLRRANIAYGSLDVKGNVTDRMLVESLKETLCTLDATGFGLSIEDFHVRLPGKPTEKYSLRTYDEVILAPMALFSPRVVEFDRKKPLAIAAAPSNEASNETTDDDSSKALVGSQADVPVTNAMLSSVRHLLSALPAPGAEGGADGAAPAAAAALNGNKGDATANGTPAPASVAASPAPGESANATPAPATASASKATTEAAPPSVAEQCKNAGIDPCWESSKLPLDFAVWHSLLAAAPTSEERLKRLAGNILVIGSGAKLTGLGGALEARLDNHFANQGKEVLPTVIPAPREMDPTVLAWKGLSVQSRLESAADFWVGRDEWEALRWKAFKEKTLFL